MTRKRTKIIDERDPRLASQVERHESSAMSNAAKEHFTFEEESSSSVDESRVEELEQQLETAIVRVDDHTLRFQRVLLHRAYADLPSDISEDEVEQLGYALIDLEQNINFWLGDIVLWYFNKHEAKSSEAKSKIYDYIQDKFDKSYSVLTNAVWIASHVPTSTRVEAPLSFTHYRIIVGATGNEDEVKMWAKRAYENGWSRRQLEEVIKGKKEIPKLTTSDHLSKAYKSVSKITNGLIKNGAEKSEIVLILKQKIEELEN